MGCRKNPFCELGVNHPGKCREAPDGPPVAWEAREMRRVPDASTTATLLPSPASEEVTGPDIDEFDEYDPNDASDDDDLQTATSSCTALVATGPVIDHSVPVPSGVIETWEDHEAYARSVIPKVSSVEVPSVGWASTEQVQPRWRSVMPEGWKPWPAEYRERLAMMGEKLEQLDERLLEARQQWDAEYIGPEAEARRESADLPAEALYGKQKIEEQAVVVEAFFAKLVRAVQMTAEDPELQLALEMLEEEGSGEETSDDTHGAGPDQPHERTCPVA
jgi:hypothetical protein